MWYDTEIVVTGQLNLAHVGLTRNKQVCARPEGRYDMRALPDDYRLQIITKRTISADEMHLTVCIHVEWADDNFGLGLM